jgi:hypothetical protein
MSKLFQDDHILVDGIQGVYHAPSWPPPQFIRVRGEIFECTNYSQITDEQREEMTRVCRGAEYRRATPITNVVDVQLESLNAMTLDDLMHKAWI